MGNVQPAHRDLVLHRSDLARGGGGGGGGDDGAEREGERAAAAVAPIFDGLDVHQVRATLTLAVQP